MITITVAALSGGQGKTTTAFFLAKVLAKRGLKVLAIDSDPQANLTFYLGHSIDPESNSLLEVIKGESKAVEAIVPLPSNLSLIPADDGLAAAESWLASGFGAAVLKRRLEPLKGVYDVCIIDSPPQGFHLSLGAIAAADLLLIPAEAGSKGVGSLIRTLQAVEELRQFNLFGGEILGVLPFRDKWFGFNQSLCSRNAIAGLKEVAEDITVFFSIPESEQIRKAIDSGSTPESIDDISSPFRTIADHIEEKCKCLI